MPFNIITELASQWKFGQMISFIKWDGADMDDNAGYGDVFLEVGYPTSYGACSFITPYFKRMPNDTDQVTLTYLAKGALNGENNGLTVIMDAETFDYGNGFGDYGERAGVGFKVGIVHHLDVSVLESNGIIVDVGRK